MFTLFFVAPEEISSDEIQLRGTQAHHAITVLRVQKGELLRLANGIGDWVEGPITAIGKDMLTIDVQTRGQDKSAKATITIAQAVLKGENQKAALDQLVQAGADSIIPWQAQRSIGTLDKNEKWREVIHAAARQSRRARIPGLASMTNLEGVLAARSQFDLTIAFHESATVSLSAINNIADAHTVLAIIGPEGGLSNEELAQLQSSAIPLVKLGDPVIRADLAGAIALGALKVLTKEW